MFEGNGFKDKKFWNRSTPECVTLHGSDGSPHTCYKQSSGWLFVGSDLFLSSGRGTPALQWKSGASAPRQASSSIGALVPVSAHAAVSNPQKGCRLHRRPSTFLSADAYPIAALRRTAARLNPGAAIKQIQHNLLVAVRVQVELDLLRRRALRIRRADRDLLAAARVTAEINRDLFSRRRVAQIEHDLRSATCAGGACSRPGRPSRRRAARARRTASAARRSRRGIAERIRQ